MKFRGRLFVLIVSVPIIAFAVIGGFMGAMARGELSIPAHLRRRHHPHMNTTSRPSTRQGDARRDARAGGRTGSR